MCKLEKHEDEVTVLLNDKNSVLIHTDAAVDDPYAAYYSFNKTSRAQSVEMLKQDTGTKMEELMSILDAIEIP